MKISKTLIGKIHVAKQQLGMDEDTYRSMLERVSGVRSAKELTEPLAHRVMREFERLGFKPLPRRTEGRPRNFAAAAMPPMIKKIEAQLADMGLAWTYADGIASQMFGIERCAWVRQPKQLEAIIAALHVEQEKRQLHATVEELAALLRARDPNWQLPLEHLRNGWERHRPTLRALVANLAGQAGVEVPR